MDNFFLVVFVYWPAVVLVAALLNMLISWAFSWPELIFDYLVGVVIGSIFFAYTTNPDPGALLGLLLVMSHGLFGLLRATGSFTDPSEFFWLTAQATVLATLVAAAGDRGALSVGKTMSVGGALLSLILFAFKAPFALLTSGVGVVIWLAGLVRSFIGTSGAVGFLGGQLYAEWSRDDTNGEWTTTLGITTQSWKNKFSGVMEHELYHSRQYIYLRDWLIPFWLLGELVKLVASQGNRGNPIEHGAYIVDDHRAAA